MESVDYRTKKLIGEIVTDCEGTIFGGFVRDVIRREYMCDQFYKMHKVGFEDASVDPSTSDRLLVPSDIDCHFKTERGYYLFASKLRQAGFKIAKRYARGLYTADADGAKHLKLTVTVPCTLRELKAILVNALPISIGCEIVHNITFTSVVTPEPVDIDVIIHPTKCPPFSNLDYLCNGLVMDSQGIHLSEMLYEHLKPFDRYRIMQDIISNIHDKIARVHLPPDSNRFNKMVEKGWNVVNESFERVVKSDEMCLLCHETCESINCYKLKCCSAHYHKHCIGRAITEFMSVRGACMHCNQECTFADTHLLNV